MRKILLLTLPAAALAACVQTPPTYPSLSAARDSVMAVEPLAPQVPNEVAEAQARLAEAQAAARSGKMEIAERRAREAIVSAELAETRAAAQQATAATRVLERRALEYRSPVVVQTPAPSTITPVSPPSPYR